MLGHKGVGLQHQKYVDVEEKKAWSARPQLVVCGKFSQILQLVHETSVEFYQLWS